MKRNVGERTVPSKEEGRKMYILEVEEGGTTGKLELAEGQICWEGFRKVRGRLIRGVPKRSPEDCFKYCRHEGCQFT